MILYSHINRGMVIHENWVLNGYPYHIQGRVGPQERGMMGLIITPLFTEGGDVDKSEIIFTIAFHKYWDKTIAL